MTFLILYVTEGFWAGEYPTRKEEPPLPLPALLPGKTRGLAVPDVTILSMREASSLNEFSCEISICLNVGLFLLNIAQTQSKYIRGQHWALGYHLVTIKEAGRAA